LLLDTQMLLVDAEMTKVGLLIDVEEDLVQWKQRD
jgi:hypothetical protein